MSEKTIAEKKYKYLIVLDFHEHNDDNDYMFYCIENLSNHLKQEIMRWFVKDFVNRKEVAVTDGRYALVVDASFKVVHPNEDK